MNTLRGPVGRLMGQCGLTCSPPCSEAARTLPVCRAGAGRLDDAVVSVAVKAPQTQRHGPSNADPLFAFRESLRRGSLAHADVGGLIRVNLYLLFEFLLPVR